MTALCRSFWVVLPLAAADNLPGSRGSDITPLPLASSAAPAAPWCQAWGLSGSQNQQEPRLTWIPTVTRLHGSLSSALTLRFKPSPPLTGSYLTSPCLSFHTSEMEVSLNLWGREEKTVRPGFDLSKGLLCGVSRSGPPARH
jgi:hypothetical protein